MIRTVVTIASIFVNTIVLGTLVIVAHALGFRRRPGNLFDWAPRAWARAILRTSGVKVVVHDAERARVGGGRVFTGNHVSWFDIVALLSWLPRYRFVAKAELFSVPLFGRAARAVGTIPIERENRKSAFASYDEAAEAVRGGVNVVVFPEGTRGPEYALRPFKKGPFVLAIAAQVPVIPTLIHGTIEVLPRDAIRLRGGRTIHVHFLEAVPTKGLTYEDRDALAAQVWDRMAEAQQRLYGVASARPARTAA